MAGSTMIDDTLRDAEGSNRLVTLLLGGQGIQARALRALAVASAEAPLAPDNPAVLAALGFLALQSHVQGWLPGTPGRSTPAATPQPEFLGSLLR